MRLSNGIQSILEHYLLHRKWDKQPPLKLRLRLARERHRVHKWPKEKTISTNFTMKNYKCMKIAIIIFRVCNKKKLLMMMRFSFCEHGVSTCTSRRRPSLTPSSYPPFAHRFGFFASVFVTFAAVSVCLQPHEMRCTMHISTQRRTQSQSCNGRIANNLCKTSTK